MSTGHDQCVRDWTFEMSMIANADLEQASTVSRYQEALETASEWSGTATLEAADDSVTDSTNDVVPTTIIHNSKIPTNRTVSIIGDNIDKNVNPRYMRIDNQVKSLHYFHSVAVVSRVPTWHLDDTNLLADLSKVSISKFLPSLADCEAIRDNFVISTRIIVENLPFLMSLKRCVPSHIQHKYYAEMQKKPQFVSSIIITYIIQYAYFFFCQYADSTWCYS